MVKLHYGPTDPVLYTVAKCAEARGTALHWLRVRRRFKYPSAFRFQLE